MRPSIGINARILATVIITVAGFVVSNQIFVLPRYEQQMEERLLSSTAASYENLVAALTPSLIFGDLANVAESLDLAIARNSDIREIEVHRTQDGLRLYPVLREMAVFPGDLPVSFTTASGEFQLTIYINQGLITGSLQQAILVTEVEAAIIGILLFFGLLWFQQRNISNPIHQIGKVARSIQKGNYKEVISYSGIREMEDVVAAIQEMQATIAHREEKLTEKDQILRAAIDNIKDPLYLLTPNGSLVFENAASAAILNQNYLSDSDPDSGILTHEVKYSAHGNESIKYYIVNSEPVKVDGETFKLYVYTDVTASRLTIDLQRRNNRHLNTRIEISSIFSKAFKWNLKIQESLNVLLTLEELSSIRSVYVFRRTSPKSELEVYASRSIGKSYETQMLASLLDIRDQISFGVLPILNETLPFVSVPFSQGHREGYLVLCPFSPSQMDEQMQETLSSVVSQIATGLRREQVEEESKKLVERSTKDAKTKLAFMANMSHEIRTPLNGLIGMISALQDTELEEEQRKFVDIAASTSSHLIELVNETLDYAKFESGIAESNPVSTNPNQFLLDICAEYQWRAESKGLALKSVAKSDLPTALLLDRIRLWQIMGNLLSNAIKFTNVGEVVVSMEYHANQDGQGVLKIAIADTGIGIARADQQRLFNPFSQIEESSNRRFGGTGLGLYVVKSAVQLLKGEISIDSEVGKGSTFTISIPSQQLDIAAEDSVPTSDAAISTLSPDNKLPKVLVVDDNHTNAMVALLMLSKLGIAADSAFDGEQAVTMFKQSPHYDIVLMDLQMPVMDGYDATRAIRNYEADSKLSRSNIIAVSANVLEAERQRAAEAGIDDYLLKPFSAEELEGRLAHWQQRL